MAGEQACLWSAWFKAHHQDFTKVDHDFDFARWNVEHTRLLTTTRIELARKQLRLRVEEQNAFQYHHSSGAILAGKPDLVAMDDDTVTVCDCKTGRPKASDQIQVQIAMHVLPLCFPELASSTVHGRVIYSDWSKSISPVTVNARFGENLDFFLMLLASDEPPMKAPSSGECRFCDITLGDCADRV
jgi:hypothetical protein